MYVFMYVLGKSMHDIMRELAKHTEVFTTNNKQQFISTTVDD